MTIFNTNLTLGKFLFAALFTSLLWQTPLSKANTTQQTVEQRANDVVFKRSTTTPKFLELVDTDDIIRHNANDLNCMAKNIYYEARGQSELGKFAVAQVTINRTKDPKFAGSVCKVVYSPNQFSWANNHKLRAKSLSGPEWEQSKAIARECLAGKRVSGMERALFFHASHTRPGWKNMRKLARIGDHVFYKRS